MISIDDFADRASRWVSTAMSRPAATGADDVLGERMEADGLDRHDSVARGRFTLRSMYEEGFSGITYPKEVGGQGLTLEHMQVFNRAVAGFDFSGLGFFGMTLGMIGPTLLECASDAQKQRWLPRMFDGTDLWIQFLSEPTGGSDLAGALTRAERDGDEWVVNGSKIWTSFGDIGDMGMLVARTHWDVPKHRGLSVFLCPVRSPGLEVIPLRLVSGHAGFCQEFFSDVRIPDENLLGNAGDGWTIASRLLVHERNSVGGGSTYWQPPPMTLPGARARVQGEGRRADELVVLAEATGRTGDRHDRQLVAEASVNQRVAAQLGDRVMQGIRTGYFPPQAGSILKLFNSTTTVRRSDITMQLAGAAPVAWEPDDTEAADRGIGFLSRQTGSILSGTTEIQRNIVSERILDLPREPDPSREAPFNELRHNTFKR